MKNGGVRGISFLFNTLFAAGVVLVLAASLPQYLLHLQRPYTPDEKRPIEKILDQSALRSEDYELLFEQTGLAPCAVDELRGTASKGDILDFQKAQFSDPEIECGATSLVTRQDRLTDADSEKIPLAPVEDGDILLSFSSHTFGWRHGHAGLVVNADKGLCLEAMTIGCCSEIKHLSHWRSYSNFILLRLKAAPEKRKQIASFAYNSLQEVPYSLTSGLSGEKKLSDKEGFTAQCAYLIWYAFDRFGYDLNSGGGNLVTVKDLAESNNLRLIQIYGLDPDDFRYDDKV